MKSLALLLPLLAVLPLTAQTWEVTVFGGRQTYPAVSAGNGSQFEPSSASFATDKKGVLAIRGGWSALEFGEARLQVTAAYQPTTSSNQANAVNDPSSGPIPAQAFPYRAGYTAVGAMVRLQALVDLGLGVDFRFEQLSTQGSSTSYDRPWLRATAGWAFTLAAVQPILGLEAAYPLSTKSFQYASGSENALQATAPKSHLGIYAGVRF